jgi:uncharacterized cupredoxin-like copper-binding protein
MAAIAVSLLVGSGLGAAAHGEDADALAPSFFSGTTDDWSTIAEPVIERRDDGVVEGSGESYAFSWIASDPRIAGTATMVVSETDYREAATALVPTGEFGTIRTAVIRIDNDGGSWAGPLTWLQLEDPELVDVSGWLTGTGAYEGLSAYVVWSFGTADAERDLWGHITAEGPPAMPEIPMEEVSAGDSAASDSSAAASGDGARVIDIIATAEPRFTDTSGAQVADIPVTPGETITFRLDNTAGFPHNFYIGTDEQLAVFSGTTDTGIPNWEGGVQEVTWVVPDDITGLKFGCTFPGHYKVMQGTFSIGA